MTNASNSQTIRKEHPDYPGIAIYSRQETVDPRAVSFDSRKLQVLEEHYLNLIKSKKLQAGSYQLSRNGQSFACQSMGCLHHKEGGDFLPDSIRWIASITKLFTTIAVFQLFERGKLNIYAPVSQYLSEFDTDMHRRITIAQLLTHTSGLQADGGYFLEPYERAWLRPDEPWIRQLLEGPLQSEPGTSWAYCSRGFMILGELVRVASGMSYTDYIQKEICQALGLSDTCFILSPDQRKRLCLTQTWEEERLEYTQKPITEPALQPPPAGGGMYSTLEDLSRIGQCLLENGTLDGVRLLGRKSVELMRSNQLKNIPAFCWGNRFSDYPYGMGLVINKDQFASKSVFGHEGYGACALYVDYLEKLVCVFFSPSGEGWIAEAVDNPRAIIWSGLLERQEADAATG